MIELPAREFFRHMPGAFLVTVIGLIALGYFFQSILEYTFLATTTYVATDVVVHFFIKTGPNQIHVLNRAPFATRGVGYLVLLFVMLIVAPVVALLVLFAPPIISLEAGGLGIYSHLVTVVGVAIGSMLVVYAYLRWLTRMRGN